MKCDCQMTLRELVELPFSIKGKISIWPAGCKTLKEQFDRIENFESINDEGVEKYMDSRVLQIFPSARSDMSAETNIVLY